MAKQTRWTIGISKKQVVGSRHCKRQLCAFQKQPGSFFRICGRWEGGKMKWAGLGGREASLPLISLGNYEAHLSDPGVSHAVARLAHLDVSRNGAPLAKMQRSAPHSLHLLLANIERGLVSPGRGLLVSSCISSPSHLSSSSSTPSSFILSVSSSISSSWTRALMAASSCYTQNDIYITLHWSGTGRAQTSWIRIQMKSWQGRSGQLFASRPPATTQHWDPLQLVY